MADCQDLVNSVDALRGVMESILTELEDTRAVAIETKDALTRVEVHLGFRLVSREYTRESHKQTIAVLNSIGDVVAERLAQHTQQTLGKGSIPDTTIPDIVPADDVLDVDSPGGTPP